jgi:tetratricopeptide (TPR) repeat protein
MVCLPGGSTRGPLTRLAILRWLARGRIGPDDRVNPVGGEQCAIADHPDFRGCFIPGSADEIQIEALKQEYRAVERRAKTRQFVQRIAAGTLFLVAAGATFVGANSRILVAPEPVLEHVEGLVVWWARAIEPSVLYRPIPLSKDLPHAEWAKAQNSTGEVTVFQRAEIALWNSASHELEEARRLYLTALGSAPLDAMAHAGLVEADSEMLAVRPELLGEIARAAVRLDTLEQEGPAVDRATAALALAKGNRLGAAESTKQCRRVDVGCALLHGEATRSVAEVLDVKAKVGPVSRVLRVLARTAFAAEDWLALDAATSEMIKRFPRDPLGYELRAEQRAALGFWAEAGSLATRARELGSESVAVRHLEAAIALQVEQDIAKAMRLYQSLSEHHLLSGYRARLTILVQGTIVSVEGGDMAAASRMLDTASDAAPKEASVMMAQAIKEFMGGSQEAAESILRELDTSELESMDEAGVHLWAAYMYLDGGKQRLARTELEEAERIRPDWHRVFHEMVWAELQTKDIKSVIDTIGSMSLVPDKTELRHDPRRGLGLGEPPLRPIAGPLLRAMDADIRFARLREPVAAILSAMAHRPGALEHLLDAIDQFPDHMALQATLASALFEADRWEEAVPIALNVVGRRPSSKWMQSVRGRSLAKLGRWNEAKDALRRSIRGDISDVRLLQWASEAWSAEGEYAEASRLLEQAAEMKPEDPIVRRGLLALREGKE